MEKLLIFDFGGIQYCELYYYSTLRPRSTTDFPSYYFCLIFRASYNPFSLNYVMLTNNKINTIIINVYKIYLHF